MTRDQLADLRTRLRADGETGVPAPVRWDGRKKGRLDIEVYRAALAAHLGIDMSGVQHAGADARARDHSEEMLSALASHVDQHGRVPRKAESALGKWVDNVSSRHIELTPQRRARFDGLVRRREARSARARAMLDRIAEHVDVLDELPKRGAEDEEEAKLATWIDHVTRGQNELDDDNRARFDALVNRPAGLRREARGRVLEVAAFVKKHGRAPQSSSLSGSPREHLLARWIGNLRDRGFEGLDAVGRAQLEEVLDADRIQFRALEAWCEKHKRMPSEKVKDDEERKLANFIANRERKDRPASSFNAPASFAQLRERFAQSAAARRDAQSREAEAQRLEEQRQALLDSAAAAEEEADREEAADQDEGSEEAMAGDCIAEERRAEVSQEMFDGFQRADRNLSKEVKSALGRALMSYVDAPQRQGAALGLDVFAALEADARVRAALRPSAEAERREDEGDDEGD
eukprot:820559-Pyramimonas_sp.AAC.1